MKNLLLSVLIMTNLFLTEGYLFAEGKWQELNLKSSNITINLDYQLENKRTDSLGDQGAVPAYDTFAKPLGINITGSDLSAKDNVSVVIVNYEHSSGYRQDKQPEYSYYKVLDVKTINLKHDEVRAGGGFWGQIDELLVNRTTNDGYAMGYKHFAQEIAVNVNGKWYKNEQTGNNIKFNLFKN
ncbi:MAG: hypothetical protein HQM08_21035 [Candidatus Riflebacteria bacterium]|nr:hypothetical protein [Candidatus Riflebacteria bacterium]